MLQLIAHLCGDYLAQSQWMAENKTKRSWPAFVHALLYSLCFVPLLWSAGHWHFDKACVTSVDHFGNETVCSYELKTPPEVEAYKVYADKLVWSPHVFRWLPWLVIFVTHFLIDRFRLARYVVWAKNWLGPRKNWYFYIGHKVGCHAFWDDKYVEEFTDPSGVRWSCVQSDTVNQPTPPLSACPTGYPTSTPIWMATWLLIIADNTCHLFINYLALRYL